MSTSLESVVALTDAIQQAVESGDWARAHTLDVERRALLEQLLASPAALAASDGLATAMTDLERRSRHLVGVVEHHRRRILREASVLKTGRAAVDAYRAAAPSR